MENKEFIEDYLAKVSEVARRVSLEATDKVIEILFDAWKNGNQVFTCGNGGSASTATHFACDLARTTIVDNQKRFQAYCLNDNPRLCI